MDKETLVGDDYRASKAYQQMMLDEMEAEMEETEFVDAMIFIGLVVGSTVVSATLISLLVRALGWWV